MTETPIPPATPPRRRIPTPIILIAAALCLLMAVIALLFRRPITARLRPPTPTPYIITLTATPFGTPPGPYTTFFPSLPVPSRDLPTGISVAPHLPARPDLLDGLGMEWVKIYDTPQIADYPDRSVLFRIDVDPLDLDGWERGLYDLAPELAGRGAEAVEIGNEPNLNAEWNGNPDPAAFADALCRAYRIVKQTAPSLTVVSGGLAPADNIAGLALNDLEFARAILEAGAGGCFDAFGYHPYGFDQPPEADPMEHPMSFRRAERVRALLDEFGLRDRQIWITEFGWLRDPAEEGVDCAADPTFASFQWMVLPRDTQAVYTARAVAYAADNWPWAGPLFVWNLDWNLYPPEVEPPCSHLRWYAMLDSRGESLPVFYALRQIAP